MKPVFTWLSYREHLPAQIIFSLLCCGTAFLLVGYPLIMTSSVYHDHYTIYSFYRNSFLSVLHFGEIRWWDPTIQDGFPSYYFSFLGLYAGTPLFWLTEGALYILHLLGVRSLDVQWLLTIYTGFLIPFLFNLSLLALARQILRQGWIILIAVMMGAFSPALLYSLSEVTFEMSAYGMLVAAALLAFYRQPGLTRYLLLNLAFCILCISFNHLSLFWNPLFLLLFTGSLLLFPDQNRPSLWMSLRSIPVYRHLFFAVSAIVCLLPSAVCYRDGADILRTAAGGRLFSPLEIYAGNPLEILLAGIPGCTVIRNVEALAGIPRLIPTGTYGEYLYLGALTLPLMLIGLIFGQKAWRYRFYLLIGFPAIALLLGGYSPFLSILYLVESPLRSVRHFGDTTFRNGLFAIIILAACFGLEALTATRRRRIRKVFFCCALFWLGLIAAVASTGMFLMFTSGANGDFPLPGFMLAVCFLFLPLLFTIYLRPGFGKPLQLIIGIMIFLDMGSAMYLFTRYQVLSQAVAVHDSANPFEIADPNLFNQENSILSLRDKFEANRVGKGVADLPYIGIEEKDGIRELENSAISAMSFNRMTVTVDSAGEGIFFWRDSWFSGWRATLAGKPAHILKYQGLVKGVAVPAGRSTVTFQFRPWAVIAALAAGWACIFVLLALLLRSILSRRVLP